MAQSSIKSTRHDQFYAVEQDGKLVHIDDTNADDKDVRCVYCSCKMQRIRGNVRVHHYRHDYNSEREKHIDCTYDLYLQAYAKKKILDWYTNIEKFDIHFSKMSLCSQFDECQWSRKDICVRKKEDTFDIRKLLTKIEFINLIRTSSLTSHSIFRIYAPTKTSQELFIVLSAFENKDQIKIPDGRHVIINIENETDIDQLITATEIHENDKISFYGFNPNKEIDKEFKGKITYTKQLYIKAELFS